MHDNPPALSATNYALSSHRVLCLSGRDALAFAQAQFMNDVAALANGYWQWNGWLTPKGRVIALFALLRIDDETVWLLLPDADPAAMAVALQRFVFRSKVTLAVHDALVSGAFAAPNAACGARFSADAAGAVELDMGGDGGPRRVLIGAQAQADETLCRHWALADLQHGLPRLRGSQLEQWTPQQLSLERLHAFSVKKGCYPGQEIVARTHFLGKAKRGLALLETDLPLMAGAEVRDGDATLGIVICVANATGRHLGLAVLPNDRTPLGLTTSGEPAREIPVFTGLAR